MLDDAVLDPSDRRRTVVTTAWSNLTGPGPTLTSSERIEVIRDARAGWGGPAQPVRGCEPLSEAAHWLAVDAGGITAEVVDDLEARGLDRFRYLETVGVVARTANLDFYARGLGAEVPPVPDPGADGPTGEIAPQAVITDGWVPAAGPMFAPLVLDALPREGEALRALHEPMYMPLEEMGDHAFRDELTRPQIEYIAARTSYLNECFY